MKRTSPSQLENSEYEASASSSWFLGFRIFLLIFFAVLLTLWFLAPISTTWIEQFYSQGIYKTVSTWLVPILSATNISISGIIALVLLLSLIISLLASLRVGENT